MTASLQELGERYGTDKATKHSYMPVYDDFLAHLRERPCRILELGVRHGASVRTWLSAFPLAEVVGVDIKYGAPKLSPINTTRYTHLKLDAYSDAQIPRVERLGPYDLIIDDGPHTRASQITAVSAYYRMLVPGGLLIIEDVPELSRAEKLIIGAKAVHADLESADVIDLRSTKGRFDDVLVVLRRQP